MASRGQDKSLDALPSGSDDSVDLNQFDEGYMNVSDDVYFPNAIDEEYTINDWSFNQNLDSEEYPAYTSFSGGASSEGVIYNQLSTNQLHIASCPSTDSSYSSDFVQALCRSVRKVDEAFLVSAALQLNGQQPPFSLINDDSACASETAQDNEQRTEQARHEQQQLLTDENTPLNYCPLHPHEIELIEAEEIHRIAGSAFNDKDDNVNIHDDSQYDPSNQKGAFMFDNDYDDKDFSSWLLYESDDGIATFKNVLGENTSGGKPMATASTCTKKSSIVKPIKTHLHDGSPSTKGSKEHTVPGSESLAKRASLDEKSNNNIANDMGKQVEHRSSTKLSSNLGPKQSSNNSHDPSQRQQPLVIDNRSSPEVVFGFQDAIVCTSTPNNSTQHSFIVGDKITATGEVPPIKEIKQSKYFLHEKRNA